MEYSVKFRLSRQLPWSRTLVRFGLAALTAALMASCSSSPGVGTAGNLDTSFGTSSDGTPDGFVNLTLGDGDDETESVAVQTDGKIVVLGTTTSLEDSENMVVARLNTNGSLDTSFGAGNTDGTPDGFVSLSLGDGDDAGQSVAVQADGKIVVLGTSTSVEASENMVLARLNTNGSLDTSFGAGGSDGTPDGFVSLSLGDEDDSADALVIQADGKILVAGTSSDASGNNIVVARLNANGSLDTSFGAGNSDGTPDGFVSLSIGDGDEESQALAVQADGKVVVVGNTTSVGDGSSNILVARLNANGSLDTSFGAGGSDGTPDGFVSLSLGDGDDESDATVLQADGKIVIVGTSTSQEGSENILVARLNTSGSLDTTFGAGNSDGTPDGFVSLSLGDGDDAGQSVAVQADGKLVVLGTSTSVEASENMVLARLNANGSLDTSFGAGNADDTPSGYVSLSLGDGDDSADGMALQSNGRIVVAGTSTSTGGDSSNIVLARLLGN